MVKAVLIFLLMCMGCVDKHTAPLTELEEENSGFDTTPCILPVPIEEKPSELPSFKSEELETVIPSKPLSEFEKISEKFPRVILGLWDSLIQKDVSFTLTHKFAEMPLNFLGFKLEYVDLQENTLPDLIKREDVYGIISWLPDTYKVKNPNQMVQWFLQALDLKKKFILIGSNSYLKTDLNYGYINELWQRLGVFPLGTWSTTTYEYVVSYIDKNLYPFEGIFERPYPTFQNFVISDPEALSHLNLQSQINKENEFALVVTNKNGAFAQEEYLIFNLHTQHAVYRKWYVNPFKFFKLALQLPEFPIPDPSTVAGRRVYFSHIDGDGWNNETQVVDTRGTKKILSSEIILKHVASKTKDLPLTVGPIAANLDPEWNGTELSQQIARDFFKMDQIEVGCHTFSHPFDWGFFKNYSELKETPFLDRYQTETWKKTLLGSYRRLFQQNESFYRLEDDQELSEEAKQSDQPHYYTPRAYARKLFDLNLEVFGAIDEVNRFAPKPKEVMVYQWSGNTLPWKQVLVDVREANVKNINGGDPRFDFLFPSYAYLCPLSRNLGSEVQVYTCASNENLYTNLWTKDFYGFVNLPLTFEWSETPLRIKGMNLYYHMYSGEKKPSLYALLQNISYIRLQEVAPIPTSHYCEMVDGFYSVEIFPEEERTWTFKNRGELQTFRIDNATFTSVDFNQSKGIIGQRHYQGSLYVYLDRSVQDPKMTLMEIRESYPEPLMHRPYLLHSRWRVWNLKFLSDTSFLYATEGFGFGDTTWIVPKNGIYQATLFENDEEIATEELNVEDHRLTLSFPEAITTKQVEIRLMNES